MIGDPFAVNPNYLHCVGATLSDGRATLAENLLKAIYDPPIDVSFPYSRLANFLYTEACGNRQTAVVGGSKSTDRP